MNLKTFSIASTIGYFVLAILLCDGSFFIFFHNLFWGMGMLGSHWLFLDGGKWTQTKGELGDKSMGPTIVLAIFSFFAGRSLFHWTVLIQQVYIESLQLETYAQAVGLALSALALTIDMTVLRKQNSLVRKGSLLAFFIVLAISNGVLGHFANATGYGGHSTRWLINRMANATEYMNYLVAFVFPIVWLIAPTIFILWKKADSESQRK